MKKLPLLTLATVSVVGILWACGGGSSDDDGIIPYDAGPDVPIKYDTGVDGPDPAAGMGTAFCDGTLGVVKAAIDACCNGGEKAAFTLDLYKNIDSYVTSCEQRLEGSIAQHRTSPSSQEYDACINSYKALFVAPPAAGACQGLDAYRAFDIVSTSCVTAFTGKGTIGDACAGDFDCATGTPCIGYTATTDGTCQAAAPADGVCGPGTSTPPATPAVDLVLTPINSCVSGFYCKNGACKLQTPGGNDAGCASDQECANGTCIDVHCTTITVAAGGPRTPAGGGCTTSNDCDTGLYCNENDVPDSGTPGATGTCETSLGNAQSCSTSNPHECQGDCNGGGQCQTYCSFPP